MRRQKQVLVRGGYVEKSKSLKHEIHKVPSESLEFPSPPLIHTRERSMPKTIWYIFGTYWVYVQFLDSVCLYKVKGRIWSIFLVIMWRKNTLFYHYLDISKHLGKSYWFKIVCELGLYFKILSQLLGASKKPNHFLIKSVETDFMEWSFFKSSISTKHSEELRLKSRIS